MCFVKNSEYVISFQKRYLVLDTSPTDYITSVIEILSLPSRVLINIEISVIYTKKKPSYQDI